MGLTIRPERPGDIEAIGRLAQAAFAAIEYSSRTEHFIVDALRRSGVLSVSRVAAEGDLILGHAAASPVTVSSSAAGWYGLGPVSVSPERRGQGIGTALVNDVLAALKGMGARGCVVLGEPGYYGRFGFKVYSGLVLPGVPAGYFQALSFNGGVPAGDVAYHAAFEATG